MMRLEGPEKPMVLKSGSVMARMGRGEFSAAIKRKTFICQRIDFDSKFLWMP